MPKYEIEIKSLLGEAAAAEALRQRLKGLQPPAEFIGQHTQLNHYFVAGPVNRLSEILTGQITYKKLAELTDLIKQAKTTSLRTRAADGQVFLVLKVAVDDTTSDNGVMRREFEVIFSDLRLEQLDQLLLDAGFTYQAKWSRAREEYRYRHVNITIDKNAGYGYLAELELTLDDGNSIEVARDQLRQLMSELALTELPADRLERMFAYYNQHWPEYYGTDRIFKIE